MDFFTHTAAVFTLHPYIARFSLLLERDVTLHKLLPRLLLLSSDIAKGSMMTPPDHCDPLDSVNAMLKSNIRQQRLLTQSLRQNGLKKKATVNPFVFVHEMLFSSDRKKLSDLKKDADRRFRNGGPGIDSPKLSNMPGESKEGGLCQLQVPLSHRTAPAIEVVYILLLLNIVTFVRPVSVFEVKIWCMRHDCKPKNSQVYHHNPTYLPT